MKIFCNQCAIHFKGDFKETLKAPCNFWGDLGLSNIEATDKKRLWDWLCELPSDEFAIKYGIGLGFKLSSQVVNLKESWDKIYPNYNNLSEKQKQDLQKKHFKAHMQGSKKPIAPFIKKKDDEEFIN